MLFRFELGYQDIADSVKISRWPGLHSESIHAGARLNAWQQENRRFLEMMMTPHGVQSHALLQILRPPIQTWRQRDCFPQRRGPLLSAVSETHFSALGPACKACLNHGLNC
jgi:hypothetical protein